MDIHDELHNRIGYVTYTDKAIPFVSFLDVWLSAQGLLMEERTGLSLSLGTKSIGYTQVKGA